MKYKHTIVFETDHPMPLPPPGTHFMTGTVIHTTSGDAIKAYLELSKSQKERSINSPNYLDGQTVCNEVVPR